MTTATQYRAKAAEYTELLKTTRSPAETREFRNLEQSFITLAENDEWLAGNLGKTNSPGADDNWYGDVFLPHQVNMLEGPGAADPMQSTGIPIRIQQLFDDAGSKGGLLQTASLRGRVARFLHKHKDDDFS